MKTLNKYIVLSAFFMLSLILASIFAIVLHQTGANIFFVGIMYFLIFASFTGLIIFIFLYSQRSLNSYKEIQRGINYYIDEEIAKSGIGVIIFSPIGKIIWASSFIKERFGQKILNKLIVDYFNFRDNVRDKIFVYKYQHNDKNYEVRINLKEHMVTLKDESFQKSIINQYELERVVIGEIEIDNFQLLQTTLPEEEIFNIQNVVVNLLEKLSERYNLTYRQYVNGKFWIITNESTLKKFQAKNFSYFNNLSKTSNKIVAKDQVFVSGCFAYGISRLNELTEMSKSGLLHSQSRGGDQISVIKYGEKIINYGSKTEIQINLSRTFINNISKLVMKKLKDPKNKKVIIYGHKQMDLDALGSAYALARFSRYFNKKVYIQNATFDHTTKNLIETTFTNEEKQLFIKPLNAVKLTDSETIIFICDTSEITRIENPDAFNKAKPENIFVFDHHRVNEQPDYCPRFNQYIDTSASSASEIITEFINFSLPNPKKAVNEKVAQLLLNGIYLDTNQFQKSTSTKTFGAASILYEWGAIPQKSVDILKMTEEVSNKVKNLLETLVEVKPGYFLAYTEEELPTDVVSISADEVLRIKGRKAAFVVAKLSKESYKMSARGINTNVQTIAESLGGGGHFSAAAVVSENETLQQFITNIKQAIVSVKDESNNNQRL